MRLLSVPFDRSRPPAPGGPWPATLQVAAGTLILIAAGAAVERAGVPLGSAIKGGAMHAAFLALGWILVDGGRPGWRGPALRLAALVIGASLLSRAAAWGALAYLLLPPALMLEARRRDVARIGFAWPRWPAAVLGLAAGTFLGVHLLVTSSLTLGYVIRIDQASEYVKAVAYDAGLSALTAEWLFRGALFSWLWRSWTFASASAVATGSAVLRYLLDGHLPGTTEVWLGAAFYTGLLGVSACALRAWSGSLLPGYLATVAFFLGYRALGH